MNENQITQEPIEIDIDRSVYEEPYVVKDGCLYEEVTTKNKTEYVKLADFVPTLKAEITYDDGTEEKKKFLISAVHKSGDVLSEQLVSADDMQTMKWLLQRWGQQGAAPPKQNTLARISYAIMQTKAEYRKETVYAQTGWKKIGGEYVFLMPNENSPYTVELQGKLNRYGFSKKCSPDEPVLVSSMLEKSIAPDRVMLPLLAVTFLSPLNHFLKMGGCEPKFVTALVGKTGSRKSTLAALFLSFFGKFTASDLPMSFHDTANSILSNIYYLKDVLTCIDDFHPSGHFQEKEMKDIAQNISRYYGDRIGRARLNSKAELQASKPPTGNALITAEFSPEISESGCARYFTIELDDDEVDLDELSRYQRYAEQNLLSGIMMTYIEWIKVTYLGDTDSFVKKLSEMFLNFRTDFITKLTERKIKFHSRVPDMLSHLKIGLTVLLEFLLAAEFIGQDDRKRYEHNLVEILLQTTSASAEQIIEEQPVTKFCEKLTSLLDSGRCYVETRGSDCSPRQKNCIGLVDEKYYYLFMDSAHSEVRQLCSSQGEHFSISKKELLKQMRKDGILVSKSNRNTISIRDSSGVINVTMLDKSKVAQRMSRDMCPTSTPVESLPEPLHESAAQGNVAQV